MVQSKKNLENTKKMKIEIRIEKINNKLECTKMGMSWKYHKNQVKVEKSKKKLKNSLKIEIKSENMKKTKNRKESKKKRKKI